MVWCVVVCVLQVRVGVRCGLSLLSAVALSHSCRRCCYCFGAFVFSARTTEGAPDVGGVMVLASAHAGGGS